MRSRAWRKGRLEPWRRDGFKSELHYTVHHKRPQIEEALRRLAPASGLSFEDHPYAELALKAKEKGLLDGSM